MTHIAVVGAALAGQKTAEALRARGYSGRLTLIGDEPHLPYDRPPLSKNVLTTEFDTEELLFEPSEWYADNQVDLILGQPAVGLDVAGKQLHLRSGSVNFDQVVIATGARARNPFAVAPEGVHTLRTLDDATRLRQALIKSDRVVIIGGGFIGLEVACAAKLLGAQVTVVEAAAVPLSRNLGDEVAPTLVQLARSQGIAIVCGRTVSEIRGASHVTSVTLDDGSEIPCGTVVVGVGAIPNTEWLADSALEVTAQGLICDPTGQAAENVWAAGDVSSWRGHDGLVHRHEHWTSAAEQAKVVARNIVESATHTVESAPYVWSDQFGRRISIIGQTTNYDSVRFLSTGITDLAALYSRDGQLVGACVIDQMRLVLNCRKWVARRTPVSEIAEWEAASA